MFQVGNLMVLRQHMKGMMYEMFDDKITVTRLIIITTTLKSSCDGFHYQ